MPSNDGENACLQPQAQAAGQMTGGNAAAMFRPVKGPDGNEWCRQMTARTVPGMVTSNDGTVPARCRADFGTVSRGRGILPAPA